MYALLCLLFAVACGDTPPISNYVPQAHAPSIGFERASVPSGDLPYSALEPLYELDCDVQPPREYRNLYLAAADDHPKGLSACRLVRQAQAESNFDPNARSPADAFGIAQFKEKTALEMGIDPWDPKQAIPAQAKYMVWCKSGWTPDLGGRTDDDLDALALGCYNHGRGNMYRNQRENGWVTYADARPHLPRETRHYVAKIVR